MKPPAIYLDAHASTPLAPEALTALVGQLAKPGNPHAPHGAGAQALAAIEAARHDVAELVGAAASEIVFTSGATEANNLAILGLARAAGRCSPRRTIVTSAIEHPSVLEAAGALVAEGYRHRIVSVGGDGRLDLASLADLLAEGDVLLLSVMAASNVTGVVQPIREAAALARRAGALIHTDAAQAGARLPLDVLDLDVDALSLSAHKMYGPPGVGALYLSAASPVRPEPLTFGGGQEGGLRSGTAPTALIAAFGASARIAADRRDADDCRLRALVARFLADLSARQVRLQIIGDSDHRLPGSVNIAPIGADAQDLTERLSRYVALSSGSACSSGRGVVSPTLRAMNIPDSVARSSVRVCFNRYSGDDDARLAAYAIADALADSRLATGSIVQ